MMEYLLISSGEALEKKTGSTRPGAEPVFFSLISLSQETKIYHLPSAGVNSTGNCLNPNNARPSNNFPGSPGSRRRSGSCSSIIGTAIDGSTPDNGPPI